MIKLMFLKKYKRAWFSLCVFLWSFVAYGVQESYEHEAMVWAQGIDYAALSHADMTTLANLLYWSYRHSDSTIKTETVLLHNLEQSMNSWSFVIHSRRNPDNINFDDYDNQSIAPTQDVMMRYSYVKKMYRTGIEAWLNGDHALPLVQQYAQTMRASVREAITRACTAKCGEVKKIFEEACKELFQSYTGFSSLDLFKESKGVDFVCSLFPQIALASFAKIDTTYNDLSTIGLIALFKTQRIYNVVWEIIESVRVAWYVAHYNAFMLKLQEERGNQLPLSMIILDKNNTLMVSSRSLPHALCMNKEYDAVDMNAE
jgi:hypothetical protein